MDDKTNWEEHKSKPVKNSESSSVRTWREPVEERQSIEPCIHDIEDNRHDGH